MTFRIIALALAFSWLLSAPANAETIRVAHPAHLAPLIFVKDGKTVGVVADILRAAAAHEGITIVFVPMASGVMDALKNGTADAIAPMLITPKSDSYDFTSAFVTTGGGLFVRAPNPAPSGFAALSGKTVATPSFGPFVSFIHQNFPAVNVAVTSSYQESLDRVLGGQADAAALNIDDGAAFVATSSFAGKITVPTTAFVQELLGLAVAKGQHADLIARLNDGLAAMRADGTLQHIQDELKEAPH